MGSAHVLRNRNVLIQRIRLPMMRTPATVPSLRAIRRTWPIERANGSLHADAARAFINDATCALKPRPRQALAAMFEGDALEATLSRTVRRLLGAHADQYYAIRRRLRDATVARGEAFFDANARGAVALDFSRT